MAEVEIMTLSAHLRQLEAALYLVIKNTASPMLCALDLFTYLAYPIYQFCSPDFKDFSGKLDNKLSQATMDYG